MSQFKSNMSGYQPIDSKTAEANINRRSGEFKFYPWYKERVWQYPGEVGKYIFSLNNAFNPTIDNKGLPFTYDAMFVAPRGKYFNKEKKQVEGDRYAKFFVPSPSAYGESCPIRERFLTELSGCQGKGENNDYIPVVSHFNLSVFQYGRTYKNNKTNEVVKLKNGTAPLVLALESKESDKKEIYTFQILEILEEAYGEINPETGKPYNSIDGVEIWLQRSKVTTSAPVGRPISVGDTKLMYRRHSADTIRKKFGHKAKVSQKGDVYAEANSDITQVDIDETFFRPTEKLICELFDLPYTAPAGSGDNASMYDNDSGFPEDEMATGENPNVSSDTSDLGFDDDIPLDDNSFSDKPVEKTKEASKSEVTDKELADLELEDFDDDIPF